MTNVFTDDKINLDKMKFIYMYIHTSKYVCLFITSEKQRTPNKSMDSIYFLKSS